MPGCASLPDRVNRLGKKKKKSGGESGKMHWMREVLGGPMVCETVSAVGGGGGRWMKKSHVIEAPE